MLLGNSYKSIVNSHLTNSDENNLINDLSDLINIENVNGDETFSKDGNSLIWNSKGADIYYQGETSKELPIECIVKYELERRGN
ncbi:MAG: hypothetical protein HFJ50_09305 [Clostridia bacterium]|jgi:putative membrane protein|nr:hypothetical protein [Clostridia bacterium]